MNDPHIRPAEFRCCGKCKGTRIYNGVDYDNNCTCYKDCELSVEAQISDLYQDAGSYR